MKYFPAAFRIRVGLLAGLIAVLSLSTQSLDQVSAQNREGLNAAQQSPNGMHTETYLVPVVTTDENGKVEKRMERRYRSVRLGGSPGVPMNHYERYIPEHGREIQELVGELAGTSEEEREELSERLRMLLFEEFDAMHEAQAIEIESMEQRLHKVQRKHHQRAENKGRIVERRMSELMGRDDPYAWKPTPSPRSYPQAMAPRMLNQAPMRGVVPAPAQRGLGARLQNSLDGTYRGTMYPQQRSQPAAPSKPSRAYDDTRNGLSSPALPQGQSPPQDPRLQQNPSDRAGHAARE